MFFNNVQFERLEIEPEGFQEGLQEPYDDLCQEPYDDLWQEPYDDLWQDFEDEQYPPAAQQGNDTLIAENSRLHHSVFERSHGDHQDITEQNQIEAHVLLATEQIMFRNIDQQQEDLESARQNDSQHQNTQSREDQSQPTHQQCQEFTRSLKDVCIFVILILTYCHWYITG